MAICKKAISLTAFAASHNHRLSMSDRTLSASARLPSTGDGLVLSLVLISLLTPGCGPPF